MWMAGGGIEAGPDRRRDRRLRLLAGRRTIHVHDIQATILHLLAWITRS